MLYNVVLVSAVQQRESAKCIQTSQPSQTSLPATHHPTSLVISEHPAELSVLYSFPLAILGFPCGSAGKESACNVGDLGLIPGLGRFPWRRERPGKGKEGTSHYGSQNPNINDTLDQIWTKEIAAGRPHCTGHPTPNNPPN